MYLSIENVSVLFKRTKALDNLSLGIEKGEMFGLIGPNGSGKTTCLKAIAGLIKPKNGNILLEDSDITHAKTDFRKIIGYSPQENSFFDRMTVKENLKYFANLYGVDFDLEVASGKLAESVGLKEKIDEYACNLSGGMRRRLNIACGIAHDPRILLLDEPTIELDPFSRMNVWKLISKINRSGTTVIVSTNSMEEARYLCKRVAFLFRGSAHYVGRPDRVIDEIEKRVWWNE